MVLIDEGEQLRRKSLEFLWMQNRDWVSMAEEGDPLIIEGGEGINTLIVLGKYLFIKGFDEQLIGCKKKQDTEVVVTLPENYPKKEFINKNQKVPSGYYKEENMKSTVVPNRNAIFTSFAYACLLYTSDAADE